MTSSRQSQSTAISSIVEAELRSYDGELLGVVDELLIDLHSGRIEYVLAIGVRGQHLQFPWSAITLVGGSFRVRRQGPQLVHDRADDGGDRRDEET